jgi:hypothetical protein
MNNYKVKIRKNIGKVTKSGMVNMGQKYTAKRPSNNFIN